MSATAEQVSTDVTPNEHAAPPELTPDQAYHLLQNERRRAVLRYLRDVEGTVEMRDVAEQVAAWENDTTVQAISSNERQRVYIPLYQSHLPKLDEEGIINYDQSRGTVTKTELVDQLVQYLEVDDADDDTEPSSRRWDTYYLGVSGAGTLLFLGALFDLPLLSLLPVGTAVVVVLTAFWMVAIGHSLAN